MQTAQVQNYLFFAGRCEEALAFYQSAIGAETTMLMRFSDSPDPIPPGQLQEGFADRVMHAEMRIGSTLVMASDGCGEHSKFDGFRLALSVGCESEAERLFNALAEGGAVDMPLMKTFWSPKYGMVTDRYGLGWMVMVPAENASLASDSPGNGAAKFV